MNACHSGITVGNEMLKGPSLTPLHIFQTAFLFGPMASDATNTPPPPRRGRNGWGSHRRYEENGVSGSSGEGSEEEKFPNEKCSEWVLCATRAVHGGQ